MTPREELTTDSTFAGRYQIIEELGKGGMGRVYKVFDTKIKEKIALKLIKPEIASNRETIERFSSELGLARKISHRPGGQKRASPKVIAVIQSFGDRINFHPPPVSPAD